MGGEGWLCASSAWTPTTRSLWRACRRWRRRRAPRTPPWSWTETTWRAAGRTEIWRAATARQHSGLTRSSGSACSDPPPQPDHTCSAPGKPDGATTTCGWICSASLKGCSTAAISPVCCHTEATCVFWEISSKKSVLHAVCLNLSGLQLKRLFVKGQWSSFCW